MKTSDILLRSTKVFETYHNSQIYKWEGCEYTNSKQHHISIFIWMQKSNGIKSQQENWITVQLGADNVKESIDLNINHKQHQGYDKRGSNTKLEHEYC